MTLAPPAVSRYYLPTYLYSTYTTKTINKATKAIGLKSIGVHHARWRSNRDGSGSHCAQRA